MDEEHTPRIRVGVSIVGYADGVYNIELTADSGTAKVSVDREDAERVCGALGVDVPDPEGSPPERWG